MIKKKYRIIIEGKEDGRGFYQAFTLDANNKKHAIEKLIISKNISGEDKIDEVSFVGISIWKKVGEISFTGRSYFNLNITR